jgi:lytic cellulose monooxygenase (C4-dehydrogenating)
MQLSSTARRFAVGALVALVAALGLVVLDRPSPALAHGSVTDPPSRNYGCWNRWGSDHLNPNMANVDPMCWQAWQANPNTMWNWNSLFREGVAGNHQAAVPDGQLCSAGRTQNGFYGSLDTLGTWVAATKPNRFTLTISDSARHGADYLLVYITKQGYDSTTQPLKWSDLELIQRTPRYAQASQYQTEVDAGTRTGRHIVYTIWQASHLDQSYYFCSDVIFTGGPTSSSSPSTSTSPSRSASASASASPSVSVPPGSCSATYTKTSEWSGGFGANVSVTAGSAGISTWTVGMTFANGQTISSSWNATLTTNGSTVTATNASYNGRLSPGQSASFGFNGTWNGTNSPPTLTCTGQ